MSTLDLPEDKSYFKIGEVAKMLGVESYVLRYWESEFEVLKPEKTKSGQRIYQRADIELLETIRELLYAEMFTIAGARRQLELREENSGILCSPVVPPSELALELKEFERACLEALEQRDEARAQRDQARQQRDEALSERESLQAKIKRLESTLEGLERGATSQPSEASASIDSEALLREREAMQEHIAQLEADLETLVSERQKQTRTVNEALQQLAQPLREEILRLESELSEAQQVARALREEQHNYVAKLSGDSQNKRLLFAALRREVESLASLALTESSSGPPASNSVE